VNDPSLPPTDLRREADDAFWERRQALAEIRAGQRESALERLVGREIERPIALPRGNPYAGRP
jgi:hypothetical protein